MDYTNGIGAPQFSNTSEVTAPSSASRAERTERAQGLAQNGASRSGGTDEATLSSASSLVLQALSGSDVRMDKVTALAGAIHTGTYDVPASDVADKVMNAMLR